MWTGFSWIPVFQTVLFTYRLNWIEFNRSKDIMNSTSPKSSLAKIGLHIKPKPFRILILGTTGVGKTGEQLLIIYIRYTFFGIHQSHPHVLPWNKFYMRNMHNEINCKPKITTKHFFFSGCSDNFDLISIEIEWYVERKCRNEITSSGIHSIYFTRCTRFFEMNRCFQLN